METVLFELLAAFHLLTGSKRESSGVKMKNRGVLFVYLDFLIELSHCLPLFSQPTFNLPHILGPLC
jgi:hypothetical protein